MAVPAYSIFEGMLRFAGAGDRERVERSMRLLGPVLAEHARAFGAGGFGVVADALRSTDPVVLEQAVRTLVARDVVVLLRRLERAPGDRGRTVVRTATLEWRLLEPAALARDLRAAQSISGRLRDLGETVDAGDMEEARSHVSRAEKEILQLFRPP